MKPIDHGFREAFRTAYCQLKEERDYVRDQIHWLTHWRDVSGYDWHEGIKCIFSAVERGISTAVDRTTFLEFWNNEPDSSSRGWDSTAKAMAAIYDCVQDIAHKIESPNSDAVDQAVNRYSELVESLDNALIAVHDSTEVKDSIRSVYDPTEERVAKAIARYLTTNTERKGTDGSEIAHPSEKTVEQLLAIAHSWEEKGDILIKAAGIEEARKFAQTLKSDSPIELESLDEAERRVINEAIDVCESYGATPIESETNMQELVGCMEGMSKVRSIAGKLLKKSISDLKAKNATDKTDNQPSDSGRGEGGAKGSEVESTGDSHATNIKSTEAEKLKWLALAMLLVKENPGKSNAKIAKEVGKSPSTLSRNKTYQAAAAMARGNRSNVRRGHVDINHESGQQGIVAYDPPEEGFDE